LLRGLRGGRRRSSGGRSLGEHVRTDSLLLEGVFQSAGAVVNDRLRLSVHFRQVELFLHGELHLGAFDADDGDGDLFADLAKVFDVDVEVIRKFGDVNQAFNAFGNFNEGTERLNRLDFTLNLLPLLQSLDGLRLDVLRLFVRLARGKLGFLFRLGRREFFFRRRLLHG